VIGANYGALGQAIFASTQVKSQLDKLTAQVSTGYVATSYAGLGTVAQTSLDLQPAIASLGAKQTAISAVLGRLTVAQGALTQISSIASTLNAALANVNGITPSQTDGVALQARSALQQVAALLDTTDGPVYVFAGTDTANPPVPDPQAITTSPFFTQIGTAVAGLATNGSAATTATTLAVASSDAAGTTPFSSTIGPAPTIDLGPGAPVQVGLIANANTLSVSGGSSTTGSYIRDILRSLATLGNLSSSQTTASGFGALVQDVGSSLSSAISAISTEAGALGNNQSQLTAEQSSESNASTALTIQLSAAQNVNQAATISQLTQVQTQLTASYKLISTTSGLSLVNFLPT
jgi:flagellar hook-associated protein 3 FlgL